MLHTYLLESIHDYINSNGVGKGRSSSISMEGNGGKEIKSNIFCVMFVYQKGFSMQLFVRQYSLEDRLISGAVKDILFRKIVKDGLRSGSRTLVA